MATKTETAHAGECILSEANGTRSREAVTFVSGTPALKPGEVVAIVTASSKYSTYDNGASDGTEVAAGVLIEDVDASAADATGVILRRDAEVIDSLLTYQAGQDAAAQTAAKVDLAALGLIAR